MKKTTFKISLAWIIAIIATYAIGLFVITASQNAANDAENMSNLYYQSMVVKPAQKVIIDSKPFTIAPGYYAYIIYGHKITDKSKLRAVMYAHNDSLAIGDTVKAVQFSSGNSYGYFFIGK